MIPNTAFKKTENGSCARVVILLSLPAIPKYLCRHKLISDLVIDDDTDDDAIDFLGDTDEADTISLSTLSLASRFNIRQRAVLSLPLYKKLVISVHSRSLIMPAIFCSDDDSSSDGH